MFIWPTVLVVLFLSIFPLVASLALALSNLTFPPGGVRLDFVGFANFEELLFGDERSHFVGVLGAPGILGWAIILATVVIGRGRLDARRS